MSRKNTTWTRNYKLSLTSNNSIDTRNPSFKFIIVLSSLTKELLGWMYHVIFLKILSAVDEDVHHLGKTILDTGDAWLIHNVTEKCEIKLTRSRYSWFLFSVPWGGGHFSGLCLKTEFARGPGRGDTCHLSNLDETLPDWRDYQTTLNDKVGRLCDFSLES